MCEFQMVPESRRKRFCHDLYQEEEKESYGEMIKPKAK